MDFQTVLLRVLLLLPTIFLFGCEEIVRTDLVRDGNVKVQSGDSPVVDLSQPQVYRNGDKIEIAGTVTRKPAMDAPIPNGYVLIQFLTPAGEETDEIWSTWSPADIPVTGSRQSSYDITYLWNPPPGTIVRVAYGPTEEAQDTGGGGGKIGTATGSGPSHGPSGSSSSHHYAGGGNSFFSGMGFRH